MGTGALFAPCPPGRAEAPTRWQEPLPTSSEKRQGKTAPKNETLRRAARARKETRARVCSVKGPRSQPGRFLLSPITGSGSSAVRLRAPATTSRAWYLRSAVRSARMHGQTGRSGGDTEGKENDHDYIGACGGRPCRRQRPIQASAELEGDVDLTLTGRRQGGGGAMNIFLHECL